LLRETGIRDISISPRALSRAVWGPASRAERYQAALCVRLHACIDPTILRVKRGRNSVRPFFATSTAGYLLPRAIPGAILSRGPSKTPNCAPISYLQMLPSLSSCVPTRSCYKQAKPADFSVSPRRPKSRPIPETPRFFQFSRCRR